MERSLEKLNDKVVKCKKCTRLHSYIKSVAKNKVKRFYDDKYWGKPLPSFGDPNAKLLIVGLAPAAHGGNRTGRMFTGDSSGDWLAKVLFDNGFANKPTSQNKNDGFTLIDAYITAAVRCAPPDNKPTRNEIMTCADYLKQELALLQDVKVIVCLGKIAFDAVKRLCGVKYQNFSHGHRFFHNGIVIVASYHPSRQNTQTGKLIWSQWNKIFLDVRALLAK
ncbi:uracil-DNA glycosylase [Candidatus Nitrosotenuis uzonensis]|uniref:Type-5 uracil-DNA glycosylase n=1 Tax=Candidatus Nitrosotenuis uzonensis TaxID=1407055 RepID=V6AUK4_9ARCH|nr:uracil-DNA glycosylase [Candidatus Nitrosotenuis uzonensis]CDI06561.1 conserved hypothetical protein [Candidatus Nitrosotenuis uzonensis]